MLVQGQYEAVVSALRGSGEKLLQAQALNELGDVLAHAGQLEEALAAWSDALDLLCGPYQVGAACCADSTLAEIQKQQC